MKNIEVPGYGPLRLENLVLDLNGTVTEDGVLIPGVLEAMGALAERGFKIYILSGDTRGTLQKLFKEHSWITVTATSTAEEKREFVISIGPEKTVCIGNGNIDVEMFRVAKLSICTIQKEGATTKALMEADIVVHHIIDALTLLLERERLIATLRA